MEAAIRRAEADDSEFLAWAILAASRSHVAKGTFDLIAPETEQDRLDVAEWLTLSEIPNACHHEHFWVAEEERTLIGAMAGYDPGQPGLSSLGTALADAFDGLGFEPDAFAEALERMEVYRTCEPSVAPGRWVIEWVATRENRRERGIASALLRRTLLAGREAGCREAQVSTYLGNDRATRVYEREGFKPIEERRHPEFERVLGCPGMVRLVRDL